MKNLAHATAGNSGPGKFRPAFRKLITDHTRRKQRERLRLLQKQDCDEYGKRVEGLVREELGKAHPSLRKAIDVPSWKVFAAILGLIRCAVTLKKGDGPILILELSAAEIAEKVGYSRSTVQAALRWLCGEPIHVWGVWVADGLGLLNRTKRFAIALFDGQPRMASRTSTIEVSFNGQVLLGTLPTQEQRPVEKTRYPRRRKTKAESNIERHRKTVQKKPAPRESDPQPRDSAETAEVLDLRLPSDDADGRALVASVLDTCINCKYIIPKASGFIFPDEEDFKLFAPKQQAQFHALVERMAADEQALVPAHVRRLQV